LLRLDRQHKHFTIQRGGIDRRRATHAKGLGQLLAGRLERLHHLYRCGGKTLPAHTADERNGHVATADECNFHTL
jgi:hypothetical protein